MDRKAYINKIETKLAKMRAWTMEWMQSANAKLAKTSVSMVEMTFRCRSATSLFKNDC